jgi:hypothetical protein
MEAYKDFSGGLNTITTNDNMFDNEVLGGTVNVDLGERGSLKRRYGMTRHLTSPVVGLGQGYFRYFKADGTFDEILAINGKLYKGGLELAITGLTSFQTTRQVEAVQHKDKLYIATGTKLVVYDGTSASVVTPYAPQPLEALYIGTNGLADNPDQYLSDGVATFLRIEGVIPSSRYGVSNKSLDFTMYVSKPSTMNPEYRMEYRIAGSNDTWAIGRDWGTNKTITFTFKSVGTYELKFLARESSTDTTNEEYYLPQYSVETTDKNQPISSSTIHSCNRVVLHWNRIILYGDSTQKDVIYISHLDNPTYVPVPNSLRFENERQEGITALVQFRDMLVAFTNTSIQALYGKAPIGDDPYRRVMLSSAIGCIAPHSAKVMGNYVAFLSQEGVHILKSLGYTENRLNVEKIDNKVTNIVPRDTDACATVLDGQYHLVFPSTKKRFRFYFETLKAWVQDESTKLDFSKLYEWNGVLYGQSTTEGHIRKFDTTVYADEEIVYQDIMELKNFDFGQPYNPKKLKELQALFGASTDLSIYVYADAAIVLDPNQSYASVDASGNVVWTMVNEPNVEISDSTVFGDWVMGESPLGDYPVQLKKLMIYGKCLRTRVKVVHELAEPNQLLGLGYIFKLQRP